MDCRKGIGLMPSLWRGLSTRKGVIPEGLDAKVVRLDPVFTEGVWRPASDGGQADWNLLDATLDALKAKGLDIILSIPIPSGERTSEAWSERVFQTVRRSAGRVWAFEISAGEFAGGLDQAVQFFESGFWTVYRADPRSLIGGLGLQWGDESTGRFISHCQNLNLPIRFVTWEVEAVSPEDLDRSVQAVQAHLDRHAFNKRPGILISSWRSGPAAEVDPAVLAVSSVVRSWGTDLEVVCFDAEKGGEWADALNVFGNLGDVRLPLQVEPTDAGVEGISTLRGEEIVSIFWHRRPSGEYPVSLTVTGLPWGNRVKIQRHRIGKNPKKVQEETFQAMTEPLDVALSLPAGSPILLRLTVQP